MKIKLYFGVKLTVAIKDSLRVPANPCYQYGVHTGGHLDRKELGIAWDLIHLEKQYIFFEILLKKTALQI